MKTIKSIIPKTASVLSYLILAFLVFYVFFLNHVGANCVGLAYNSIGGQVTVQPPGWHITSMFVRTVDLSTMPMRVEIPTQANVINQRLVWFKPEGASEFVRLQSFSWFSGLNLGNTLMGFSLSEDEYSFLGKAIPSTKAK